MAYRHDIFVSYRRNGETVDWLDRHFLPLVELHVGQELGKTPTIFVDRQLEAGTDWPTELANRLSRSRILLALWARDYFSSPWCTEELAVVLAREQSTAIRITARTTRLVVPALIHDGDRIPRALRSIQTMDIRTCFISRMASHGETCEKLEQAILANAAGVARAIKAAPSWREAWADDTVDHFRTILRRKKPLQRRPPRFSD